MHDVKIKKEVRQFYNEIGWQLTDEGLYQNTRYEDLRPVVREYIHKCHMRVKRHLNPSGKFLLDAGSGPVQYPEYLTYSMDYQRRVCADISIVALKEARKQLEEAGLYVVADVAHLPFKPEVFDGVVSLHTFHHLPIDHQWQAYREIWRVMGVDTNGVIINGWMESSLMRRTEWLVKLMEGLVKKVARLRGREGQPVEDAEKIAEVKEAKKEVKPDGTFIRKLDADWLRSELGDEMNFEIRVWRSVNVRFLRALIKPQLAGRQLLKVLFWLEERFPYYFGERGQYPLIVLKKGVKG